jgi:hypothetical protein
VKNSNFSSTRKYCGEFGEISKRVIVLTKYFSEKIMSQRKIKYVKYKRAELEDYIQHPESCVKKIRSVEALRFTPNNLSSFTDSVMNMLNKKIGKFDTKLDGIVLDFRKTKVLSSGSLVRNDSTAMLINVETDFYVFSPNKGALVNGLVKHINQRSMETIISVVIYRVFNVKVTVKGSSKIQYNQEIQIRIKDFHFDNVIPYIEGEVVGSPKITKKISFDTTDSGISESSISPNHTDISQIDIVIKKERIDVECDEPINSYQANVKKRKRTTQESIEAPSLKRVKQEVIEEIVPVVKIKQEKSDNYELNQNEKKKDKKKKRKSQMDDFESSLHELFGTSVKN